MLAIEKTRHPSPIAFGGTRTTPNRVGWADRGPPKLEWICYKCYQKGDHISPNCDLKFSDYEVIIKNYELLGPANGNAFPTHRTKRPSTLGVSSTKPPKAMISLQLEQKTPRGAC